MAKGGFGKRLRRALRFILTGTDTGYEPGPTKLTPVNDLPTPKNERKLPETGPIPGLSHELDDTFDERNNRRQLVRKVMEWFDGDGASWDHNYYPAKTLSAGRWVNEHGSMRSPARLSTVAKRVSMLEPFQVEWALDWSREEWQEQASGQYDSNPFYYH